MSKLNITTELIDGGTIEGVVWRVHRMRWGFNGYIKLPDNFNGDLTNLPTIGPITYDEGGWIGFDTMHHWCVWPDMPNPAGNSVNMSLAGVVRATKETAAIIAGRTGQVLSPDQEQATYEELLEAADAVERLRTMLGYSDSEWSVHTDRETSTVEYNSFHTFLEGSVGEVRDDLLALRDGIVSDHRLILSHVLGRNLS